MTYPHPSVRSELTHWVQSRVDVSRSPDVAHLLGVTAVPVAVLLAADGTELARIPNVVEPEPFADALRRARQTGTGD